METLQVNDGFDLSGNFNQTGANTFSTGTGAVSLNGATSVTGTNTFSVGTGATTLGGSLDVTGLATFAGGVLVPTQAEFNASGSATFAPNGANDVTFLTDADSSVQFVGLQTATGSKVCVDGSNNLVFCASQGGTLQQAYDDGNVITTTNARDIEFNLDDTATDSNFDIDIVADNTVSISRIDGVSTESPAQLLLLENLDTD